MTARIELWHTAKLPGSGSENGQLAFKWRDDMTARIELRHTAKLLGSGSENGQLAFKWRDDMTARIELWHTAKLLGETQIMIKAETRTGFTLATGGLTPPNGA